MSLLRVGYAGKSPGKDSNSGYKHAQKAQAAGQLAIKAALDEVIERLTQASGQSSLIWNALWRPNFDPVLKVSGAYCN